MHFRDILWISIMQAASVLSFIIEKLKTTLKNQEPPCWAPEDSHTRPPRAHETKLDFQPPLAPHQN